MSELYLSHNPLVEDQDRLAQVLSTIPESTQLDIPIPIPCTISLSPSGGGISLRWRTQPGRLTMVLASDDLRSWYQLGSQPAADAEFTTFTDHAEPLPASRFYRVLLTPQLDEWETCDDFIILY